MDAVAESDFPDYEKLRGAERPHAKRILGLLLKHGREFCHSELCKKLGVAKSTLSNNLDVLKDFIHREKRGHIRLKFKTPLGFIADTPGVSYAYLGLLGVKGKWEVSETETAVKVLGSLRYKFDKVVVITTQEAIGSWSDAISSELGIEWYTVRKNDFNRIERIEEIVKPKLAELMKKYVLIMDCTSGQRPAGIAYYRLAQRYKVPLIYVYEPTKELIWLISKETLKNELRDIYLI